MFHLVPIHYKPVKRLLIIEVNGGFSKACKLIACYRLRQTLWEVFLLTISPSTLNSHVIIICPFPDPEYLATIA